MSRRQHLYAISNIIAMSHNIEPWRHAVPIPPHKEDPILKERRTRQDFHKNNGNTPIKAIPCRYVGADLSHLYAKGVGNRQNYPDWCKLTPAYQMSNSGMTTKRHVTSFWSPNSNNFIGRRIGRWWNEEKIVNYANRADKIAAACTVCLLILTAVLSIWQLLINATPQYVYNGHNPTPEQQAKIDNFNKHGTHWGWAAVKFILSSLSVFLVARQIYMRTTVPLENTIIKNFGTELPEDSSRVNHRRLTHQTTMRAFETEESMLTKMYNKTQEKKQDLGRWFQRGTKVAPEPKFTSAIKINVTPPQDGELSEIPL